MRPPAEDEKQRWSIPHAVSAGITLGVAMVLAAAGTAMSMEPPAATDERIREVRERTTPALERELAGGGFKLGDPVFIRIFKESRELEVWLKPRKSTKFKLWKKWPIAAMSGKLGPKLKQGDLQAPEGFYSADKKSLNPNSRFHLSFNIGFPNAYDAERGCTGSLIMVHGNKVSIGCFAMTDPVIEEIYLVTESALEANQRSIDVHVFPFRMTPERLAEASSSPWQAFWSELLSGYQAFEQSRQPPTVRIVKGHYQVR